MSAGAQDDEREITQRELDDLMEMLREPCCRSCCRHWRGEHGLFSKLCEIPGCKCAGWLSVVLR